MGGLRVVLADLSRPPDTSVLCSCDDTVTARSIEIVRKRLLRRRKQVSDSGAGSLLGALRRLQNPQLAGYHPRQSVILLSEPFNGMPSAIRATAPSLAGSLVRKMLGYAPPAPLARVLAIFGRPALERAVSAGVKIALVPAGQRFCDASASVGRTVPDIDSWTAPPSGLFIVDERRMLLRDAALRMTAVHEFAHALDSALAQKPRSYFSFESEELRYYFATATGFVNEYAATGLDEYFAESVRAYVEVNDPRCAWLPLTRQDLYLRDPRWFALIDRLFRTDFQARERRATNRADGPKPTTA